MSPNAFHPFPCAARWDFSIDVYPEIQDDGIISWGLGVTVEERENEVDNLGVSLANAGTPQYKGMVRVAWVL